MYRGRSSAEGLPSIEGSSSLWRRGGGDRGGLREQAFRNVKYEWLLIWNGGRSLQLKKASFRVGEGKCFQIQRRKP